MRTASKPISMDTSPCTSKPVFVAYIEALVGAAPHFKRIKTTDPRMKLDARFAKGMIEFIKQEDLRFDQYVARKLRAWYAQFPPAGRRRRPRLRGWAGRRPGRGWGEGRGRGHRALSDGE